MPTTLPELKTLDGWFVEAGEVRGMTALDEDALWNWLQDLIRPFAEVLELGLSAEIARRLRVGAS